MIILQNISYIHPNRDRLFTGINLTVNPHDKIALIGNNGTGKSTLLKIIAGELQPSEGQLTEGSAPYLIPQIYGQYNHLSVAQALNIEEKFNALNRILNGKATEQDFETVGEDWTLEERCQKALKYWDLDDLSLDRKMASISGGQKTRVLLAGIMIHQPDVVLMDEPSNHLDFSCREKLYDFIRSTRTTLLIVSHDRKLLNLLEEICVLTPTGVTLYGGNYAFYREQRSIKENALQADIQSKEKALRKAREIEREMKERQNKMDARGKGKQEKAGVARIMMNTLRDQAENSTSKLKKAHAEKVEGIVSELQDLRSAVTELGRMKFGLDNSSLHTGKILFTAGEVNFSYSDVPLWKIPLNFTVTSGERLSVKGNNGSGKTTLIKLMLGQLQPTHGTFTRADVRSVYIDQDYSLIENQLTVYQQAGAFNNSGLEEHDIKMRLHRFLFSVEDWDKPCEVLSGGEKMRLMLCCLTIGGEAPDLIVLDEPTNNLDIQNVEILTAALNEYRGTLVVVSHDERFLEEIGIERSIEL